jgi:hypothetical protein
VSSERNLWGRRRVDVVEMTAIRRAMVPLAVAVFTALALAAAGSVGATAAPVAQPAGATGPTGATGPGGQAQPLSASVSACHDDPLQANRYAIFASTLTAVADTRTMAVEFILQERSGGSTAFTTVNAPGFDVWVTSQPGVGIYTYNHEVTSLPAPAAFRVLVHARWLDRRRRVIRRGDALSPVCVQPLETPNLAISGLRHTHAAAATTDTYSVEVQNNGAAAAPAFQVSLSIGGVALPNASLAGLAAGATQTVQFSGPACTAGQTLTAVADPTGALSEPANPARTRTFPCLH